MNEDIPVYASDGEDALIGGPAPALGVRPQWRGQMGSHIVNLRPILSDWLREQAEHNGTTEVWELCYALANYIRTVDPDWRGAEIQTLLAEMEQRDPDLEPEFGLPCDGDAIMP